MDTEIKISDGFSIPSDGLLALLIGHSYSIISFYYKKTETDFEKKVNTPGLLDAQIMHDIKERILSVMMQERSDVEIYEREFIQLYTWHYIAASCANDKEPFFKHFIARDGGVMLKFFLLFIEVYVLGYIYHALLYLFFPKTTDSYQTIYNALMDGYYIPNRYKWLLNPADANLCLEQSPNADATLKIPNLSVPAESPF